MSGRLTRPDWRHHDLREDMFAELATTVADQIRRCLISSGRATIALSGGNTPGPFHQRLAREVLDWSSVTVTLTDERLVDESSDRSNARMVRETLMTGPAADAVFIPLWRPAEDPAALLQQVRADIEPILPLDVCVAGLGEDCHTASLFPGAPELIDALDPKDGAALALVTPPDGLEPRITLTGPVLRAARHRHLLMAGAAKREAFSRAETADNILTAPVQVLMHAQEPLQIHYAP